MTDTIDWTDRLRSARDGIESARRIEAQTIRDAAADGVPSARIAEALGVKNRSRITQIVRDQAHEVGPVDLTPVVYLRGAGAQQATWERMHAAMWLRGWATVSDRTTAWHLARGGCPVVLCDFSARDVEDFVTVAPVAAKYFDDGARPELVVPRRLRVAVDDADGDEYTGWRHTRPRCDHPEGRATWDGRPVRTTDADALARLVAEALEGRDPDGW